MREITLTANAIELDSIMHNYSLCELTHNGVAYVGSVHRILTPGWRRTSGTTTETRVIFEAVGGQEYSFPVNQVTAFKVIEE